MNSTLRNIIGLGTVTGLVALGSALAAPASAATVACGQTITQNTTLTADVGPCPGDGIVVGADNITLDLGGHSVIGTPPGDGTAAGIRLPFRTAVTVQHGTVRNFNGGVVIGNGSGNTIRNLTIRDNIGLANDSSELGDGIAVFHSSSNRILGNFVKHNGYYDGIGILGLGSNSNLLRGNIVQDTVGILNNRSLIGTGVIISHFLDQAPGTDLGIHNNDAVGNVVQNSFATGISNVSNNFGQILGNKVIDNGKSYFGSLDAIADDFSAHGIGVQAGPGIPPGPTGTPETNMLIKGNIANHNALVGIIILSSGNRIDHNTVYRNGLVGILANVFHPLFNSFTYNDTGYNGAMDIWDITENCDNNGWFGNHWGPLQPLGALFGFTTAYNPDCTARGGSGPNPPAPASVIAASASSASPVGGSNGVPLGTSDQREVPRGHPAGV